MRFVLSAATLAVAALLPMSAFAQTTTPALPSASSLCSSLDQIVSRPTQTDTPCVVQKGVLLEAGYQNISVNGVSNSQYPNAEARIGTGVAGLEADVFAPTQQTTSVRIGNTTISSSGWGGFGVGAKYLIGQMGNVDYGVEAAYHASNNSAGISSSFSGAGQVGYAFSGIFSLLGSLGFQSFSNETVFVPSIKANARVVPGTNIFAEWANFSGSNGGGSSTLLQIGANHQFAENFLLDATIGTQSASFGGSSATVYGIGGAFKF